MPGYGLIDAFASNERGATASWRYIDGVKAYLCYENACLGWVTLNEVWGEVGLFKRSLIK